MHDQPIENNVGLRERNAERGVLGLLLEEDRPVWTLEEIARDIGGRLDGEDACDRLEGAGLVIRSGDLVIASRAAQRAHELSG